TLAAQNVVVTDSLDASLKFISASETQGSQSATGNTVTFNLGTVNPGATITLHIVAQVSASIAAALDVANTATLSFSGGTARTSSVTIHITSAKTLPVTGSGLPDNDDTIRLVWLGILALILILGLVTVGMVLLRRPDRNR